MGYQSSISNNQYIYIYKTEAFEAPTNFHVRQYFKKKHKTKKKKNVIKDTLSRCLPPDALPFSFTMLCHLFLAFLFYQHLFDQTHCKPTAKHRI